MKESNIEVCTACFVASCREHAHLHYNKSSHQFTISLRLVDAQTDQTSIDSDLDSDDSSEYNGVEDLQCALRCWQCGEEEHGEVIGLPPSHDGTQTIDAIIDAIRLHFGRTIDTPPPSSELDSALPVFIAGLIETSKLRNRYLPTGPLHVLTCPASDPRTCFTCQMHKFVTALQETSISHQVPARLGTRGLEPILPQTRIDDTSGVSFVLFDILDLCKTASMTQSGKEGVFDQMKIQAEIRTECNQCKGVAYKVERMDTIRGTAGNVEGADVAAATFWSIDSWATIQEEKFDCPKCHGKTCLIRRRFASFPAVLVIEQANGFVNTVDWGAIKGLDLDRLRGLGPQEGETLLPEPRPVTPEQSRPKMSFLSPPKSGKRQGLFPPSPTKASPSKGSPTKRKRAETLDRLRQTTPSPTRRRRQMENAVPSPMKRAKELVSEEMAEEEADDQEVAAICALGFDREMAIQALEETGGDVKKAVATLLTWEAEEDEDDEDEDKDEEEDDDGDDEEEEPEEEESEEEEEESEEEEVETDEGSTTSSLAALQKRYGRTDKDAEWKPAEIESGKYVLRAIVGHNGDELWAVLKRDGMWVGRNGLISRSEENARLEGMRLEFWDRL